MSTYFYKEAGLIGCATGLLTLTGFVFFHAFFFWTPVLAVIVGGIAWFIRLRSTIQEDEPVPLDAPAPRPLMIRVSCAVIIAIQAIITWQLLIHRTDAAISSPWQVLPASIFPLFAAAVFLLLIIGESVPKWLNRCLWAWQYLLAFGVSAIVYRLGFGFDPFIHQAAARSLVAHGDIQLPSILYIGQYALEAGLTRITTLSISQIDRWLVPSFAVLLGTFLLPKAQHLWGATKGSSSGWPLLLLAFLPFTFTVPYHLAYPCLLLIVILLPHLKTKQGLLLGALLVAVTGSFHPLLAIPALALLSCSFISHRWKRRIGFVACLLTSIGLMGAFYFYVHQLGGMMSIPTWASLRSTIHTLFGFPYDSHAWPWYAWTFYRFLHLWPFIFSIIGWFGYRSLPDETRILRFPLLGVAGGMLLTAIFLAASTSFVNIISTEQYEFALRLRYAIPILFFPGVIIYIHDRLESFGEVPRLISYLVISLFATGIWYTSYPQANRFVHTAAPGVSFVDIDTVTTIESLSNGRSYAALTPQMTSAAALRSIGFDRELSSDSRQRYPYAIPTGGEFYQQYLRLWREPNTELIIEAARSITHEQQLFIAIPVTWDPNQSIHKRLAPLADTHTNVDGAVMVYQILK